MKIPSWLMAFRRNDSVRGFGRGLEHALKRWLHALLRKLLKAPPPQDPARLESVRKILLLRPNFRIGNTLTSTPLIAAMRARFPGAQLDYFGADTTAFLLENLPLDSVFRMSRSFILRPWAYVRLLGDLRRRKYDLAVAVGNGSFSDMICMRALNARYRMGSGQWAEGTCNILVDSIGRCHAYDVPVAMARVLGVDCRDKPAYAVSREERDKALARMAEIGLAVSYSVAPFLALFVGGHKHKRWPLECWEDLVRKLRSVSPQARILVFLGPEESAMGKAMRANPLFSGIPVVDPLPLRDFAAMLQQARLVVAPDTGPMHLAVALDVPTIAVLNSKKSLSYAPRGDKDVGLLQPTVDQVCASVCAHPHWPEIRSAAPPPAEQG